jgi:hypothetical protein
MRVRRTRRVRRRITGPTLTARRMMLARLKAWRTGAKSSSKCDPPGRANDAFLAMASKSGDSLSTGGRSAPWRPSGRAVADIARFPSHECNEWMGRTPRFMRCIDSFNHGGLRTPTPGVRVLLMMPPGARPCRQIVHRFACGRTEPHPRPRSPWLCSSGSSKRRACTIHHPHHYEQVAVSEVHDLKQVALRTMQA